MRRQFAIGSVVVALGIVALLIMGVRQSSARHMTLDVLLVEADSVADRRIQLGGCVVVPGTIEWDEYRHRPEFQITDGESEIAVRYTGNAVLPDTFQDRAQVVALQIKLVIAQRRRVIAQRRHRRDDRVFPPRPGRHSQHQLH